MPPRKRPWVSVPRLANLMGLFLKEHAPELERVPLPVDSKCILMLSVESLDKNYNLLLAIASQFLGPAPCHTIIREAWVESCCDLEVATTDLLEDANRIHDLGGSGTYLGAQSQTGQNITLQGEG